MDPDHCVKGLFSSDCWDEINMTCCDFELMEIMGFGPKTLDIQKEKDEREKQTCKLLIYLTSKKITHILC